jgi:hypothetical protein
MGGRMSLYDDHEVQVLQPNGSFLSDEKARDFMIDRFLPAAKAMISETNQYASKKPIVGQGQQKPLWKIGSTENSSPLNQHRLKSLCHKEGLVFESDDSENYTANTTACELFPHFGLLNPMPGERMENEVLICFYLIFFSFILVFVIISIHAHARIYLFRLSYLAEC